MKPDRMTIAPLERPPRAVVRVPGSKSITNRALPMAALASLADRCELRGILDSEDTRLMAAALASLGFRVRPDWSGQRIDLEHVALPESRRPIPAESADLFVGNSGTTMRFLTALVSLGRGWYRLDGIERMRERPIQDLLVALEQLGVTTYSEKNNGCPPVIVEACGLAGGWAVIRGGTSSQFLSGLLIAAPYARKDVALELEGELVSAPYVDMTVKMMRSFGVAVETPAPGRYHVPAPRAYRPIPYAIEPDASAASYFFAAAAITGGEVTVPGLGPDSLQGDVRFVDLLERMGCEISRSAAGITVRGAKTLVGIDADMNAVSDTVMTLAAVACFARGPTTIRNVAHVRHKETDRLAALAKELAKLGAAVEERPDGLGISPPQPVRGAAIETYNDHRMAMSLALVGLRVPGVVILNPGCVAKTYPGFFVDLNSLRQ